MAFKDTYALILKWEGVAYENDPDDDGGETFCGITRKFEPSWQGWAMIDDLLKAHVAPALWPQQKNLMDAVELYYHAVFQTLDLDDCPSDALDSCIMGGWVNQGPRVEKWLQEVINDLGGCVTVDGQIGPGTMKELRTILLNPLGEKALLHGLMIKRVAAYAKSKPKFIAGLLARLLAGA